MSVRLSPASILRLGQAFIERAAVVRDSPAHGPDQPGVGDRTLTCARFRALGSVGRAGAQTPAGGCPISPVSRREGGRSHPRVSWQLGAESSGSQPACCWNPGRMLPAAECGGGGLRAEKPRRRKIETRRKPPWTLPRRLRPPAPGRRRARSILLMDVQLAVSMRFGSRRLLLREVLDRVRAPVVELDRRVQERSIFADGRLDRAWEVVVIDGNYGLRSAKFLRRRRRPGGDDG